MNSNPSKSSLLGRLRTAVNRVRFLLRGLTAATSSSPWRVISLLRSSSALFPGRPRLSFTDHRPSGLMEACSGEPEDQDDEHEPARESLASSPGRLLHRTASSLAPVEEGDVDIDEKAEIFIQNFYRQLKLQKKVSLELKYSRGYSFTSSSSSSLVSPISINLSATSPS